MSQKSKPVVDMDSEHSPFNLPVVKRLLASMGTVSAALMIVMVAAASEHLVTIVKGLFFGR